MYKWLHGLHNPLRAPERKKMNWGAAGGGASPGRQKCIEAKTKEILERLREGWIGGYATASTRPVARVDGAVMQTFDYVVVIQPLGVDGEKRRLAYRSGP